MNQINEILNFKILSLGNFSLTIGLIISIIIVLILAKLVLALVKKILFKKKNISNEDNVGNLFSLFQVIKYVVWIIAILIILQTIGLKLNMLLAGSAALLVGVGLGLQNTFNDFVSGIILLFEGTIKVGDVLEVEKNVVKIKHLGLRTSEAINRDDITIIIPNSILVTSKVINWSHQTKKTRFRINVGVAYGSDVNLVLKILKESALEHPKVNDKSLINARFIDFGNSSLDFELLFFSTDIFRIENIKSDIRQIINQKFIENKITIPFPQMDVYLKNNDN